MAILLMLATLLVADYKPFPPPKQRTLHMPTQVVAPFVEAEIPPVLHESI